jgi:ABC-2 type transport system permease protein
MITFTKQTAAVASAELHKLLRDPTELFSRAVQPILWLVVFGQVFSRVRDIPTGGIGYLAFLTPGILAQSVLFSAIFYGIAVIWERDLAARWCWARQLRRGFVA